jgi:hypothetical protein
MSPALRQHTKDIHDLRVELLSTSGTADFTGYGIDSDVAEPKCVFDHELGAGRSCGVHHLPVPHEIDVTSISIFRQAERNAKA